jgi:hypothetical protein
MSNNCENYIHICFLGDIDKFINNEYLTNKNYVKISNTCIKIICDLKPDFDWFEYLMIKYPKLQIINEGEEGVWIGYTNKNGILIIQEIMSDDICVEMIKCRL